MGNTEENRSIYDYGRFEGSVFVFNEPQVIDGHTVEKIDLSYPQFEDGIRYEEVIEAMLDPEASVESFRPEES